jgi:hypothetical protein
MQKSYFRGMTTACNETNEAINDPCSLPETDLTPHLYGLMLGMKEGKVKFNGHTVTSLKNLEVLYKEYLKEHDLAG